MFWTHLRSSVRGLLREPGFTTFAILTLALGIGASTAMFSVFQGILLAPVPYAEGRRVVSINTRSTDTGHLSMRVTGGDLVDLVKAANLFDTVAQYAGGEVGVQLRDRAEWASVYEVSPNFFDVFQVAPQLGRLFNAGDQKRSLIVNPSFALRAFGGTAHALGQTIRIDQRAYQVVGVVPEDFSFPSKAEVWMAGSAVPENLNRTAYNYRSVARLKSGVTPDTAMPGLTALSSQLAAAYPDNRNKKFEVVPVRENMVRGVESTVALLMGAVLLLLLISCANVAHLLLARAAGRTREFAVRSALGAGRRRIIGQMLAESLTLGIAAGLAGILFAFLGVRAIILLAPENLPRMDAIGVNWTVLGFAIGVSVLASLIFGIGPAWQASRGDVQEGLRSASGRGVVGGRSARLRNALVACEIALSFTLALGAGLLVRSFVELNSAPLGFRTAGVLVVYADAPASTLEQARAATRFYDAVLPQLQELPGVQSAAAAMGLPAGQYGSNGKYAIEGMDITKPGLIDHMPDAGFRLASKNYFQTMGIPLVAGREFSERDQYDAPFVAIISQSLARESFPHQDPIGKKIICGLDSDKWMSIVGVVGDVRSDGPSQAPGPELYMPFEQHPFHANEIQLAIHTTGRPEALADAAIRKIRSLNPEIAVRATTMQTMVAGSIATPRFRTFLVTLFAAVALLLAMAGVYAVTAYLVSQRTQELGLRMALGSAPAGVVGLVLRQAGLLAAAGLALGILLSLAGAGLLQSLLFGIQVNDFAGYAGAAAAIAWITLAAAVIPAWRASRIDPAIALREE